MISGKLRDSVIAFVFVAVSLAATFVGTFQYGLAHVYGHYDPGMVGIIAVVGTALLIQLACLALFASREVALPSVKPWIAALVMIFFSMVFGSGRGVSIMVRLCWIVVGALVLACTGPRIYRESSRISIWLRMPVLLAVVIAGTVLMSRMSDGYWIDDF